MFDDFCGVALAGKCVVDFVDGVVAFADLVEDLEPLVEFTGFGVFVALLGLGGVGGGCGGVLVVSG